jgi:hypothetical protein
MIHGNVQTCVRALPLIVLHGQKRQHMILKNLGMKEIKSNQQPNGYGQKMKRLQGYGAERGLVSQEGRAVGGIFAVALIMFPSGYAFHYVRN